jgi:cell division protein ZapE
LPINCAMHNIAMRSHPMPFSLMFKPHLPSAVSSEYARRIAGGVAEADAAQEAVVALLALLESELAGRLFSRKASAPYWLLGSRQAPIKGCYIFGEVGRGKTMLMDMFFQVARVERKRRVHFHEFMAEVHERVHLVRQKIKRGEISDGDPIRFVAAEIARDTFLVCFDELHVTDITDAMILGRLFKRLFELGVVVVATSNVPPSELYKDGLNRALFLPFLALIEEHMQVVCLAARADFRLEKLSGAPVWHVPADDRACAALDAAWRRLTAGSPGEERSLPLLGRTLHVPWAALGVARFSFAQLCEQPLAGADYLKIAHEFHTVLVDRVPVMDYASRNEARRFIILVDTLYDNAVKLVASAAAEPFALYQASEGSEACEFRRAASRLIEMRSQSYLSLPHGQGHKVAMASTEGLVET